MFKTAQALLAFALALGGAIAQTYEAEDGTLSGTVVATEQTGFTGLYPCSLPRDMLTVL